MGLRFAEPSGCTPDQVTGIMNAIADTRTLAQAAISALKSSEQNPAAYFFPSSYAQLATGVFSAVLTAAQSSEQLDSMDADSKLNPIQLTCKDLSSMCNTPAPDNNGGNTSPRLGYIPQGVNPAPGFGTALIVICPAMLIAANSCSMYGHTRPRKPRLGVLEDVRDVEKRAVWLRSIGKGCDRR
ncbi:hypothetical protein G7Y79_00061g092970 [Physcia stellaris]|nr:hypothetical protein G7Y79_00061g092970 [Physcia stellaris]